MEWADELARVAGDDPVPVAAAAAAHARGAALAAQGCYAAALGPLGDAVQRWETLGRPYDAARARAALGAALLATSPREQARRPAGAGTTAADPLPRARALRRPDAARARGADLSGAGPYQPRDRPGAL